MSIQSVTAANNDPHTTNSSKTLEEEALYNRFLAGDNEACIALYKRHNQRLFTYCLKMVGNREQAEDLTQEAWGRLIELKGKGRKLENPIGFLTRIARNLCLDILKAQRRTLSLDDLPDSVHPSYSMHELSEVEEFAVMSLQSLSFDFREVLVLNIYCGYSFEEIAVMLGKSPRAIWTRASRARAQLRKLVFAVHPNERTPGLSTHTGMEEDHDQ